MTSTEGFAKSTQRNIKVSCIQFGGKGELTDEIETKGLMLDEPIEDQSTESNNTQIVEKDVECNPSKRKETEGQGEQSRTLERPSKRKKFNFTFVD